MLVWTEQRLMKELALLLSIISLGLWLAQDEMETHTDRRLASFNPDQPVSPSDLERYRQLFHVTLAKHPQLAD